MTQREMNAKNLLVLPITVARKTAFCYRGGVAVGTVVKVTKKLVYLTDHVGKMRSYNRRLINA